MKFEVGEKVLWWDGEFVREGFVLMSYENKSRIYIEKDVVNADAYNCDLYYKTPNDMRRLVSRIEEMRYRLENISDELRHKIEEAKNDM
ncbi:MAG: hypothetical protein CV087_08250 [Candidatus Brocadia sp. WS118]|nr:MAG: hypothetical protein CV087_08250 [Candidatus Brocadia sp. WS118]